MSSGVHALDNVTDDDIRLCRNCAQFAESRQGCPSLKGGITLMQGGLRVCCLHPKLFLLPTTDRQLAVAEIHQCLQRFFSFKAALRKELGLAGACTQGNLLEHLSLAMEDACNVRCLYCEETRSKTTRVHGSAYLLHVIGVLHELGLLSEAFSYDIGGFEPTLSPYFEDIARILVRYGGSGVLYTNATRYSPMVAEGLRKGTLQIIVSLDCGTRQGYRTVKQKDFFSKVLENLSNYAQCGRGVMLKYIMLPENCLPEELVSFCDLAQKLNVASVIIAGNILWEHKWDSQLEAMLYLRDELRRRSITYIWNTLTIRTTEEEAEERVASRPRGTCDADDIRGRSVRREEGR